MLKCKLFSGIIPTTKCIIVLLLQSQQQNRKMILGSVLISESVW